MKLWPIALSAAIALAAISYSTAQYNMEVIKQQSFMMKICTEAGGDWVLSWDNPICKRPGHP